MLYIVFIEGHDGGAVARQAKRSMAMADKDSLTREYISQPNVFAEIFNYLVYGGVPVIQPDSLEDVDTRQTATLYKRRRKKTIERYRDLFKKMVAKTDGQRYYVLFGIENQTDIDYGMPARVMLYDAISYDILMKVVCKQHKGKRKPFTSKLPRGCRVPPVLTAVVYFGLKPWDAPITLHDMIDFPNESLRQLVPDYPIHVISPAFLPEENYQFFKTDFPLLARFLSCSGSRKKLDKLVNGNPAYNSLNG